MIGFLRIKTSSTVIREEKQDGKRRGIGLPLSWLLWESTKLLLRWCLCVCLRTADGWLWLLPPHLLLGPSRQKGQTDAQSFVLPCKQEALRWATRPDKRRIGPGSEAIHWSSFLQRLIQLWRLVRSLHDMPLRASLVLAFPQCGCVHCLCSPFTWVERGFVMTTRHLSFLHNLTVSLFAYAQYISWENTYSSSDFFVYMESKINVMSVWQFDWEVGVKRKKKFYCSLFTISQKNKKNKSRTERGYWSGGCSPRLSWSSDNRGEFLSKYWQSLSGVCVVLVHHSGSSPHLKRSKRKFQVVLNPLWLD